MSYKGIFLSSLLLSGYHEVSNYLCHVLPTMMYHLTTSPKSIRPTGLGLKPLKV
jgi:hypothetical protein